jgi:hypothetical protein
MNELSLWNTANIFYVAVNSGGLNQAVLRDEEKSLEAPATGNF